MGQGQDHAEREGVHETCRDVEKTSPDLKKFIGIQHFIGIDRTLCLFEIIQAFFVILAPQKGRIPDAHSVRMTLAANSHPDQELIEQKAQDIMKFSRIITVE